MKNILYIISLATIFVLGFGCNNDKAENKADKVIAKPKAVRFLEYNAAIFKVKTFDGKRILEEGRGFLIDSTTIVAKSSLFTHADRATVMSLEGKKEIEVEGFTQIDRFAGLVLLRIERQDIRPVKFAQKLPIKGEKIYTFGRKAGNTLPIKKGTFISEKNLQGSKVYKITSTIYKSEAGIPVFNNTKEVIGLGFSKLDTFENNYYITPFSTIQKLANSKYSVAKPLYEISKENKEQSARNNKIKGVVINTEIGAIQIRFFHDMPQYRDNFLKLSREHYFDSLLIHRVIKGFIVQTGASDSRDAKPKDEVGWKGPGYTLPANIHPTKFHQRGMIGSPRLPDQSNRKKRSDGSQFYIVSGRLYNNEELKAIEEEQKIKFSTQQRKVYNTIGGAPTLDQEYTIFAEVVKGMHIIDILNQVEVDRHYRPLKDIRIKNITILE